MDIDLLFTETGEAGLICSENLVKKALGLLFDMQTGLMSIEYADMDALDFNIPIDEEFHETLDRCQFLHIGAVKEGNIAQAYQIPLMFLDDPYRGEMLGRTPQAKNPLQAFDFFIKRCVQGQPVHRDDLGDESNAGCVLGDAVPSALQFAPHLARRHAMEVRPVAAPSGPNVPGMGLGGSGGGRGGRITRSDKPPKDKE